MNAKLTTDTVLASRYKIRQVIGNGGYSVPTQRWIPIWIRSLR